MEILLMSENDAKEICDWKYSDEYSIYNLDKFENLVKQNFAITNELKRISQFRSVYEEGKLIGYFRFIDTPCECILGLGLKPEKCGKSYGKTFMNYILSSKELKNKTIKLEVRSFNKRAINCYKSVGFNIINIEEMDTLFGKDKFVVMRKNN